MQDRESARYRTLVESKKRRPEASRSIACVGPYAHSIPYPCSATSPRGVPMRGGRRAASPGTGERAVPEHTQGQTQANVTSSRVYQCGVGAEGAAQDQTQAPTSAG